MSQGQNRRRAPKPRSWIADPAAQSAFGKIPDVPWKPALDDPERQVHIDAARWQHRIAIHLRRTVAKRRDDGETDLTFPAIARGLTSVDYDGFMRLMRGDVAMSLLHVVDLTRQFDKILVLSEKVMTLRGD